MLKEHIPELFCDENAALTESLERMISERRLPHAIIIEGADSALNDRLARLIGWSYLCTCPKKLSGQCRVCQVMKSGGEHPDILEVEGSGKTGAISIDSVRQLKLQGSLTPTEADGIVWLLCNCDIMLPAAQNAFLKLFEEPPEGVMFIMTCKSALKLLETIRSRAFLMRVVWHSAAAAQRSGASVLAEEFALALISASECDAVMLTSHFSQKKGDAPAIRRELLALFDELGDIFRQAMIIGAGAGEIIEHPSEAAAELARVLSGKRLELMYEQIEPLRQTVKNNAPIALATAAMCVRLRTAAGK